MVELFGCDSTELRLFLIHQLCQRKLLTSGRLLLVGITCTCLRNKAGRSSFTLFDVDGVLIHGLLETVAAFWCNDASTGCPWFSSSWNDTPPTHLSTGFPARPPKTHGRSLHESPRAHTPKIVLSLKPKLWCHLGEQPTERELDRQFDILPHAVLVATHTPTARGEPRSRCSWALPAYRGGSLAVWVSISMRAWSLIFMSCQNAFADESRSASSLLSSGNPTWSTASSSKKLVRNVGPDSLADPSATRSLPRDPPNCRAW